ncbi:hybrid PKS-NRPS PsoA [Talaromyces marneffei ATCC 18224]|uniref:Hybrid PKS-NRPS PsoA n=2 Tax=Talaromyces marneffei TaxID=37727 RepID=B6QDB1_TALMQ|nr:putative PKS/NRPS8 [Talaromyces marneffei]EEA23761.1 hybrid PKS-NRPS PsoA [Talaromyces marneffei ATCC 18224]
MGERTKDVPEPIALIGSSCRFPGGCNSPAKLWELLKEPVDIVAEIPSSRFNSEGFYHENPEHPGTTNVTKAYLLDEDPCVFDNDFFGISAKEAESMDPQQRIILEVIYESLEYAGYSLSQLRGSSTGVFVGQMSDDYREMILRDADCHPQYTATGSARSILANRVSYIFDWKGPSLNIDTACSSSLAALHLAVQSLRSGESDMAVVAGVNLVFNPEMFSFLSSLHMISPSAQCRMWDASADGYGRGEGFAAVVIKTLSRALVDGDDIESVIRNTAMNQDGRSAGLTVPSAAAQTDLIKLAYARCGLDCEKEVDRCQYFEAHGTGTPTGDPKEAEGIYTAFFPHHDPMQIVLEKVKNQKVYVGSIKTVIGHLESTAGLASLLKVSQAVKYGLIPPNLHFNLLNPDIEPFYHHLEVPTSLKPWPKLYPGAPRRADVNSFGFGGTNVHAIVESWDNGCKNVNSNSLKASTWGPFVLSAHSQKSLAATIESLSETLKKDDSIDLQELAWTLQNRRTHFKYRASFSATDKEVLSSKLDLAMRGKEKSPLATQVTKVTKLNVLGVFTGQGAQWPSMGKSLFLYSARFRRTIQRLESILNEVPDSPSWSLTEELLRQGDTVRTLPAEIAQPLCTALQVALVDLLKECGITFSAVVGHSSGEIAAAYAAGVLSVRDAIIIAYYRGYHCRHIQVSSGKSGKMLAVGMPPKDAASFCRQSHFSGRIVVAAENSHSSVTLSGDCDAIDEAKVMLDEAAVFTRILKVDTAYHSHHMKFVLEPYLTSLKNANIQPLRRCFAGTCNWFSSVYSPYDNKDMTSPTAFEHEYWADNMINPVLFLQAITSAIQKEDFNLALEIGPHPALKGPATKIIRIISGRNIPYQGVLERNKDSLDYLSNLLGFIWQNFDPKIPPINFEGFQKACNAPEWSMPRVHKGLPPYRWDHDKPMLRESRRSKGWRMRNTGFHELLGRPVPGGTSQEIQWRNILKFEDVDWFQGHQFQNQILFPASGYLVMAADAAAHMLGQNQSIQMIELQDIIIHNGVTLKEGYPGIDMAFYIKLVHEDTTGKVAEFTCICRNVDAATTDFEKDVFTGRILVTLGPAIQDVLPRVVAKNLPMTNVSIDRFYFWMHKVGLQYSDPFLLESIQRRLDCAKVITKRITAGQYTIHPATLDSVIQGLYASFSYPGDGRMWTTYLPKSFQRVRFDMTRRLQNDNRANTQLAANCYLSKSSARSICGDIDVYCLENGQTEIQIQDAVFSSLDVPSAANDRTMFWKTTWNRDIYSIAELALRQITSADDFRMHEICERAALFYLNQLCKEIGRQEMTSMESHIQSLMHWAVEYVLPTAQQGQNTPWDPSWNKDTPDSLMKIDEQYKDRIDLKLIHHLGSKLASILRGEGTALQVLREDNMLDTLYTEGLGFRESNAHLGNILDHLSHKYPRMQILEIGAGTGGSTVTALGHLKSNVENYTFTDISPAFFSEAQTRFREYEAIMKFRVLDIEGTPAEQGFQPHSYDLIIAAHVLHATKSIAQTVRHCRELLRPGGYMILLEITNPITLRIPFLFGALPGWWLGHKDGRTHSPTLTEAQWNAFLTNNSFSGVDCSLRDFGDDHMQTFSVMVTQAIDERVNILKDPLNLGNSVTRIEKMVIIGGHTLVISKLTTRIQTLLSCFVKQVVVVNDLEDVPRSALKYGSAVICLSGLEEATFLRMDECRLSAMQSLFRDAKYMLLGTRGSRADDPYASMMVGVARAVSREAEHLRLKLVDVDYIDAQNYQSVAVMLSEMLLQMICLDLQEFDDVFWSNETEVAIEDGNVLIPRIVPDDGLNDFFNSTRHKITRNVCPTLNPVEVRTKHQGIHVTAGMVSGTKQSSPEDFDVSQVLSSSLFHFVCLDDDRPFYICLAQSADNENQRFLAISETNCSIIKTKPGFIVAYDSGANADDLLSYILTTIMCESILRSSTGTIWIHNADDNTAEIISHVAKLYDISVFLTTSTENSVLISTGKGTFVHPRAAERECRSLLPRNVGRFVNMGPDTDNLEEFAMSFLGHEKVVKQGIYSVNLRQAILLSQSKSRLLKTLEDYSTNADLFDLPGHFESKSIVKANQLDKLSKTALATCVISWVDVQSVPVPLAPVVDGICFATDKTYFLVGLTGDVGLSLCQWMADHGCKYLVIASRNPHIPPDICEHLQKRGVTLRVCSLDVANMTSLKAVHKEIVSSMPPIAGVANGALVVRDRPFDSMSLEDLTAVFEPKVTGSQNLDELFYSTSLDFFILFSSVSSIVGHTGQANYHAANLFMSTLALQRRKRGLAASVMHFGMLLGFGFLHGQAKASLEARFQREDLHAIPEQDFHAIFAQAVISGRPDSGLDLDIIVGLGTEIDTPWRCMPRFSHCRVKSSDERHERGPNNNEEQPLQSIQDRLKAACNEEQATSALKETIASRVSLALGSPNKEIDQQVGLIRLGLDSLAAVEIRSWLLRVLEIDVPVLRFLSGSSLSDICLDVLNDLPVSLKSWVNDRDRDFNKPSQNVGYTSFDTGAENDRGESAVDNPEERTTEGTDTTLVVDSIDVSDVPLSLLTRINKKDEKTSQSSYKRKGDLSHGQAELYFLHEYLQNNAYNVAYYGRFRGHLDLKRLQNALFVVGKRHEALRSAYFLDKTSAKPVQAVLSEPRIIITHRTVSDGSDVKREIDAVKDYKFEIEKGIVMKVAVMSHSPDLHTILISHHHIALDGVAWGVFIADLAQVYAGRLSNMSSGIPQSIDIAKIKATRNTPEILQDDLTFWEDVYRTVPEPLPLFPFAKYSARPATMDYDNCINNLKLPIGLYKVVEMSAGKIGVTPFHFYLASFVAFLSRCLMVEDIAIGVVDANRTEAEDMKAVGYFLNMLPVRIIVDQSEQFDAVARRSLNATLAAIAHSHAPLDSILGKLRLSKSTTHHPLFQVAINYRKTPSDETDFGRDGKIVWDGGVPGGNPYDMLLNVVATPNSSILSLITQRGLYGASDGALILKWYTRALEALAQNPSCEISRCPISSDADIKMVIELGLGDVVEVPWKGTITDRVDNIAGALPDIIAIQDEDGHSLTYTQTIQRMTDITRQLQSLPPGSYVAMLLDPVSDAVCCILAILRLNLVWIPLDTRNHLRRLQAVLEESRPRVLVCHDATQEIAKQIAISVDCIYLLNIDHNRVGHIAAENNMSASGESEVDDSNNPNQPAMILYTSGSTGLPKGVMLTHEGLINQIYGTTTTFNLGREITLQQSPLGFDLMLDQIFLALANGGTIVMVGKSGRGDPTHIANLMVRHGVTLTHFVPSEYSALLNYGQHILTKAHSWRYAMSGGEKLTSELRRAFCKLNLNDLKLLNVYGPAEITLACARGIVPYREGNDRTDYLHPSPNYGLQIMDIDMNVMPVGFPGEICISGQGVGLGYLQRQEESAAKFVKTNTDISFSSDIRLYRSGDKGRILPDGTIEVLGRLDGDTQVKINGFRVELDEIANAILHISDGRIANAAASLRTGRPLDVLVAFVEFDVDFAGHKSYLIDWIRLNLPLPPPMRPTFIVPIERMPVTANGKTDRNAVDKLPIPEPPSLNDIENITHTLTSMEKDLKEIWEETLSSRTAQVFGNNYRNIVIQPNSDFFQIGGNSILMIKLKALIEVHFGVTLSMPELFHTSTLHHMATLIGSAFNNTQDHASSHTTTSFLTPRDTRSTMNWDLEIASLVDGLHQPSSVPLFSRASRASSGLIFVLTGATGFIGRHVLSHLVQDPRVAQIHCLAIRPDAAGRSRHASVKSDKIIEYTGDLSTINLGLSDSEYKFLTETVDCIIHNGADVSLLKTYHSLRHANVLSTRTLCQMSIPRGIPLHYISTASVGKAIRHDKDEPLYEVPASPGDSGLLNLIDGYAASKWVSEKLLDKVATHNGPSAYVHRLAHVMGNDTSELDAVGMLTKYSVLLHAVPCIDKEYITGQWDFITVHEVAKDIVESAIGCTTRNTSGTTYVNHCSEIKVPHEGLKGYLEEKSGVTLREMDMEEWLTLAKEKGLHPLVYEFLAAFNKGKGQMVLPMIAKGVGPDNI